MWNDISYIVQKKVKSGVEKLFEEGEVERRRGRKNKNGRCAEGNEREELKKRKGERKRICPEREMEENTTGYSFLKWFNRITKWF